MTLVNTVREETPARVILEDLRDQTGHTASLGALDGPRVSTSTGSTATEPVSTRPTAISESARTSQRTAAVGKALLASLLDSEFRGLLPSMSLNHAEPNEAAAEALLTEEIQQAKRDGIVFRDEYTPAARAIAVPITRWLDKPILAVKLTIPASAYTKRNFSLTLDSP